MIEFRLPALGADMDEGTLLEWVVQPGDRVKKGQVIAVVDTSKAAIDVETWHDGTVGELLVSPGTKMPVGTLMTTLLEEGEMPGTVRIAAVTGRRRAVTPAARRLAREKGIDAEALAGTGPEGAVTLADVQRGGKSLATATTARSAEIRKTIASAMARSKREIPHYYVAENIPLRIALAWLDRVNAKRSVAERILPAALLIKAVAVALRAFPELNGFFRDGKFESAASVHVGVAISLRQGGLAAPALMDADRKPVEQLMRELADLVKRCRAGSLRSAELIEPTVTVTNLGDQGVAQVFGVIYPPQVALVGFGRIVDQPWAEDGALRIAPGVTASLSADHRVSDGHRGAMYLAGLRDALQLPEELDR
ncbi:branched-chain alpha-keto acid dehydrogenase subunit E2 (plasmid) [Cupriavidus sp. USMAHM13]|uniref:dihydrolipoamide acetyltransferase family protein n=1 Tax=Cupriavidus sp. USMAHM13 TaxID=1389192 RepID=UPI0008A6FD15|nr:dihydrolipoamide acetyltransferase family protein [Cupriavidus sp. USMAHM13]AOZ04396.1 branched-chain alpha-keto acid dehydrogenase subunit E2 [Cupriavidus sp. USMAHM13]